MVRSFSAGKSGMVDGRFELVYTPKHGSWLNIAEIELNVVSGQCLKRHIGDIELMSKEVAAWERERNNKRSIVDWQFTAENVRIELKRLYPVIF